MLASKPRQLKCLLWIVVVITGILLLGGSLTMIPIKPGGRFYDKRVDAGAPNYYEFINGKIRVVILHEPPRSNDVWYVGYYQKRGGQWVLVFSEGEDKGREMPFRTTCLALQVKLPDGRWDKIPRIFGRP